MKRRDEIVVGATIFFSLSVVTVGAIYLAQFRVGGGGAFETARFRTVGGLSAGNPVVLRGVRVGRVREIAIGDDDWVEATLQIYEGTELPANPGVIAASASLFGEWQAEIIDYTLPQEDPNVQRDLNTAAIAEDATWPGATLPDIGQLTAQAGRIATDIATVSSRIQTAFDSQTVSDVQRSIFEFGQMADTLSSFAKQQTEVLGDVTDNIRMGTDVVTNAAMSLERALTRFDSATSDGSLDSIIGDVQLSSREMRESLTDLSALMAAAREHEESFVRLLLGADTIMTRLSNMTGTVGLLLGDSTLYIQATDVLTEVRALIADVKENPRKYFKFSVF